MSKPIVQICFSLKNGLTIEMLKAKLIKLKSQLDDIYQDTGYELHSCHLTKELCVQKGFDTSVPDLFAEIFGDIYHCELTEETFDDAMRNLGRHRQALSERADKLVIIVENDMTNIALALSLFTDGKVILM